MKRIVAFALLGLLAVGCSKVSNGVGTGGRHSWTHPQELRVAIQSDVKSLNPLLDSNTTDVMIDRFMFEPLISADNTGGTIPMLATTVPTKANGGISPDGLTITYHLRTDVKWTDGVPVTSKDVKFSWQAIMNPNNNIVSRNGYDIIKSIDTPDDATVVVHLKHLFSPFVNTFFADSDQPYPVVPMHVLAKYPNINEVPFDSEPTVSDGPFRFAEWVHGDHITLTRNSAFFLGKPRLKRIILKVVPDENTSVNLLKTHDIDWIFEASIHNFQALQGTPDTKIVRTEVNGYEDLQINTARPILRDVRVRQAIAYAIDKPRLISTLTFDQDKAATEDIPDWMWAFDPNVKSLPFDPGKARTLLTQAGWTPGPDGIRTKNGRRLTLVMVSNPSNATRRQAAVQLQSMFKRVGIEAQIKFFTADILYAPAGMGGILQLGKFDLALDGWYAGIDPDDSSQFICANKPPGGYNYSRYCSSAMNAAQKQALSHYSQAKRKLAYAKTQALLAQDVPEIFFWWTNQLQPISVDFHGLKPSPVLENWNAWQWSI